MTSPTKALVPLEAISQRILLLRGVRVLLDSDLAELYGVPTKRFNEQVKRNLGRFPGDFMFQLNDDEHAALRSQFATSKASRGGRRYAPYAFTEHGARACAEFCVNGRLAGNCRLVRRHNEHEEARCT